MRAVLGRSINDLSLEREFMRELIVLFLLCMVYHGVWRQPCDIRWLEIARVNNMKRQ